jgi:hypothetical protein
MPKTPIDYNKTIIYKLVCNDLNIKETYVGHTTDFKSRKSQHKKSISNINAIDYNCKKSKFIRENGGWENWSMIQIELYPCNNLQEAIARERYWFEIYHAKLNTNVPNRSKKEYNRTHKEQKQEYNKTYFEQNKERIKEQIQVYYETHKAQIYENKSKYYKENKEQKQEYNKIYFEQNKEKIKGQKKEYYEEHKEQIYENKRKYYEENKDKINSKRAEKYECECGSILRQSDKSRHLKSLKHCQLIE